MRLAIRQDEYLVFYIIFVSQKKTMHSKISCLVTLFFLRTCYSNPKLRVFPLYAKLRKDYLKDFFYTETHIYTYIYIQILLNNLDLLFFSFDRCCWLCNHIRIDPQGQTRHAWCFTASQRRRASASLFY